MKPAPELSRPISMVFKNGLVEIYLFINVASYIILFNYLNYI